MFGALICGLLGLGLMIANLRDRTAWQIMLDYPLRTTYSMELGFVLWMAELCGYFGRRAFVAARRSIV
jgi:hypothetical protein